MICGRASLTVIKKCETEEHFISTSGNDISFPFEHGSLDFTVESRVSLNQNAFLLDSRKPFTFSYFHPLSLRHRISGQLIFCRFVSAFSVPV